MKVRNATSAGNKIMQKMCTTLNSRAWGIDYIAGQPTVQKLDKQIGAISFICNHFRDLPALQNLNAMEAENQYVQLVEYLHQYYDFKKYDTSSM